MVYGYYPQNKGDHSHRDPNLMCNSLRVLLEDPEKSIQEKRTRFIQAANIIRETASRWKINPFNWFQFAKIDDARILYQNVVILGHIHGISIPSL